MGKSGGRIVSVCRSVVRFASVLALLNLFPTCQAQIDLGLQEIARGFHFPVYVTHSGDGSDRLFVVERRGKIRIIAADSTILPEPFLDLGPEGSNVVNSSNDFGDERGLLGLAFHPNYAQNGRFFVHYSLREPDQPLKNDTVIAEYSVSDDPNVADPAEQIVLGPLAQPFGNHNGGSIAFNLHDDCPGCLYIALGDGGAGDDPLNNGQNVDTLLGAILRIDVDHPKGTQKYGIPSDNPFVGRDGADEIYAYGLRNPYRMSFDREDGRLFVGDVGQNATEEIDLVESGDNLGWRRMEGTSCYIPPGPCNQSGEFKLPIAEYPHTLGCSVTGGYVYRGNLYPALEGLYFFGDYCTGRIWSIEETGGGAWSAMVERLPTFFNITGFGEDEGGELSVIEFGPSGTIHRILDRNQRANGDLNADNGVDGLDIVELLHQARRGKPSQGYRSADENDNSRIDFTEVLTFSENWKGT